MLKIDKDTAIYCSFSTNPGNNGCEFFNKQFQIYKLNAIYKSFRSESIKESIEAVKALDIKGFALSMPFKIHVLDYLNEVDNTVKKIGSVNTVINNKGILKGYNTDWIGVKKFFELSNFKSIYIIGDGGFSKAIQYTCKIMGIEFEIINRKSWNKIYDLNDQFLINATPIDIPTTTNKVIDLRPNKDSGKKVALYQAQEQFKIYTGFQL